MRSDTRWIDGFRAAYDTWWEGARPLLEEHQYAQAFRDYPWPAFAETPWTPVTKPLHASRVAVVTTAGLYRRGVDRPFNGATPDGDTSYRALPADVDAKRLAIAHQHFNHGLAEADLNTVFPLERLQELTREGLVGALASTHYSTMGYALRAADLAEETAPAIALRMAGEGVDVALIVPV